MSTIVVTGAAGFIASHVVQLLLDQGNTVIGVDNLNDAYDVRLKTWRLEQLQAQPGFEFHRLDIGRKAAVEAIFAKIVQDAGGAPDAVINLAARAGVRQSLADPWVYYQTNVDGTLNLLEQCRTHAIPKFVLASTSSIYGGSGAIPSREDQATDQPLSPYTASKKAAEVLCHSYHYLYGIDVTVFRYFTVYGPAGRPDMSLFRFTKWISQGEPVRIYGDGGQSRDFTYVGDIARGTVAGLLPLGYEIINLGSDTPVVLLDAMRVTEQLVGKPACLEFTDRHAADVLASWADVSRAKAVLDWQPEVSINEGLRRTVRWYQENEQWVSDVSIGIA